MKNLSQNWFFDRPIDLEHKTYVLLDYLQQVNKFYEQNKLYPYLKELIFHYNNINIFLNNKENFKNKLKKDLIEFDFDNYFLKYCDLEDINELKEVDNILNYSFSKLKDYIDQGKEIYNFIEKNLIIEPVGIIPINKREGYILIKNDKNIYVFKYDNFILREDKDNTIIIKTEFYKMFNIKIFEKVKEKLLEINKELPNPMVFGIESKIKFPLMESVLPIVKRRMFKLLDI